MIKLRVRDDVYELDEDSVTIAEMKMIKQRTGLTFVKFGEGLEELDPDAVQGLIYLMKTRAGEALQFDALNDLAVKDIEMLQVDEEPEVPTLPAAAEPAVANGTQPVTTST